MLTSIKSISEVIQNILFPNVCLVCGLKLAGKEQYVCRNCLKERFEPANPDGKSTSSDTLLPEGVVLQHALWKFDKGGYLQDLLHQLKYHRLTGVGTDLGGQLGISLGNNRHFVFEKDPVLIPVPLHSGKKRKRGYNQAYYIAKGLRNFTEIPIIKQAAVVRIKNTSTQTGFSLEKRRRNIENAFRVDMPERVAGRTCIIVDDVFTTGATSFELARKLLEAGAYKIMITSVAQA